MSSGEELTAIAGFREALELNEAERYSRLRKGFVWFAILYFLIFGAIAVYQAGPYRTWGYPVVPAIFVVFYVFFLASMLWNRPLESCTGLLLLVIGFLVHVAMSRRDSSGPE